LLRVTVAVPTYRRQAQLPRLLDELRRQAAEISASYEVELLVVDNDADGSAKDAVAAAGGEVQYVVEPTPGISAVRNRALDESRASRLLATLDDDEHPHDGWLRSLTDTWALTKPAIVAGRVVAEFDGDLDPWLEAGRFFVRDSRPTGTTVSVAAAGNWLLDLEQLRKLGVRFDPAFELSGGEDTMFSRQVTDAGGRIVWCNEAVITDVVPRGRMTRTWALHRARSHGNIVALVGMRTAHSRLAFNIARVHAFARGVTRIGGGSVRCVFGRLTGSLRHEARGLRSVYRGVGMVAAAAGVTYREYARDGANRHRWRLV
jgi:succinoglycan biosynthesis protein ExoM